MPPVPGENSILLPPPFNVEMGSADFFDPTDRSPDFLG